MSELVEIVNASFGYGSGKNINIIVSNISFSIEIDKMYQLHNNQFKRRLT